MNMLFEKKYIAFRVVLCVVFSVIICRLYYLQIAKGETYSQRSESNFIQEHVISHSRGHIFDREGHPLVDNRPARDIYVTFALLDDSSKALKLLQPHARWPASELRVLEREIAAAGKEEEEEEVVTRSFSRESVCNALAETIERERISGVRVTSFDEGCDLIITAKEFPSHDTVFRKLQELIQLPSDQLDFFVKRAKNSSRGLGRFKPTLLVTDIDFNSYARLEAAIALGDFPGVVIVDSTRRRYINNQLGCHILGFINEVSGDELKDRSSGYRMGDQVGRKGLEARYEKVLRGEDGVRRFVVDAKGRRYGEKLDLSLIGQNRVQPAVAGNGLRLSIDSDLQRVLEKNFLGVAGAAVVLDVETGFVLAMASFPSYDPNIISVRDNSKALRALSLDPLQPWVNKVTQQHYAPGSTFKPVVALAGLQHGVIETGSRHYCSGQFKLGRAHWRCFLRSGHGYIGLGDALKSSCDCFFYQLGFDLGSERLAQTARLLGFGQKTGIDVNQEISGVVPDKKYYAKRMGYTAPGFVVNSAIGQGDVAVTPIQLAVAYAALINGGKIFQPQLVTHVLDESGVVLQENEPIIKATINTPAHLNIIRESLSRVTESGGTAYGLRWRAEPAGLAEWLNKEAVPIGGKTGTAQVVKLSKHIQHLKPGEVAYLERDHAWFVGFAPADKPKIVAVVLTEHGGFGGEVSAPAVAQVIKAWQEKYYKKN